MKDKTHSPQQDKQIDEEINKDVFIAQL